MTNAKARHCSDISARFPDREERKKKEEEEEKKKKEEGEEENGEIGGHSTSRQPKFLTWPPRSLEGRGDLRGGEKGLIWHTLYSYK